MEYKNPAPTVNVIILDNERICLIKRNIEPHKNKIAIPGGFVDYGETVENAAIRECKEETGLDIELIGILGVYSDPERNPTKHTISTVFIAKPINLDIKSSEEGEPFWKDVKDIELDLAFDHNKIFSDFLKLKKDNTSTFWSTKK